MVKDKELLKTRTAWLYLDDSKKDEPLLYAELMDAEGDFFRVDFLYDYCATVDFSKMTHIALSMDNLFALTEFVDFSEEWYDNNL